MKTIIVSDMMQRNYRYFLSAPAGKNFHKDFKPDLSPKQMLSLGVFDGKYMTDCQKEFPKDWFKKAKLSQEKQDVSKNYFKVHASQPLYIWKKKGWINEKHDPRGWFQWYARYYMGRRLKEEDARQIKRWQAMQRHVAQIVKNCRKGDVSCRPKQRQALLHWAYDSRKM
ncbi:MAG: hypothetical protein MRY49_01050 [Candidatus Pacebacteria bacterium]|nr:hypothetical protein [Candidatus Paceibacterota bacterium]